MKTKVTEEEIKRILELKPTHTVAQIMKAVKRSKAVVIKIISARMLQPKQESEFFEVDNYKTVTI